MARFVFVLAILMSACGDDSANVESATCSACSGAEPFTEGDCSRIGQLAGCSSGRLVTDGLRLGCANGCRFEECDQQPMCTSAPASDASR